MRRFLIPAMGLVACWLVYASGNARAADRYACVQPSGRLLCVVNRDTVPGLPLTQLCNHTCAACQGQCRAIPYDSSVPSGHWREVWREPQGIDANNRLVPGPDAGNDARTILREGLVAPAPLPPDPRPQP